MAEWTLLGAMSSTLGWAYVVCWGVSLYPPVILNHRLRSVEGMSIDFAYLNFWGCVFYLASVSMLYFSTTVRLEYALRHSAAGGGARAPLIRFNDVIYGMHSLALVLVLLYQFYLSGYRRSPTQHLSAAVKVLTIIGLILATGLLMHAYEISTTRRHYEIVDVANMFGVVKVFLSSVKYFPQAYHNYRRKSVKGFAVHGCAIDIIGGVFCISQLVLDGYIEDDMQGVVKHPVKLLLALVAMAFGVIFLIQNLMYRGHKEEEKLA